MVLTIQGHWVLGALLNNQWSFAGWGDRPVNSMLLQYFINYNLPDGWYISSAPILTANWKAAKAGDVWTVPIGGGVGKLFRLGDILSLEGDRIAKLPINTQLQAYGNAASDLEHLSLADRATLVNGSASARRAAARLNIDRVTWR